MRRGCLCRWLAACSLWVSSCLAVLHQCLLCLDSGVSGSAWVASAALECGGRRCVGLEGVLNLSKKRCPSMLLHQKKSSRMGGISSSKRLLSGCRSRIYDMGHRACRNKGTRETGPCRSSPKKQQELCRSILLMGLWGRMNTPCEGSGCGLYHSTSQLCSL